MRTLLAVTALMAAPALAIAQGPPGTNLTVDVRVTAVSRRGDTTAVTYALENLASSIEQLFQFTVDAPSRAVRVERPQPSGVWKTATRYRMRSVAAWTVLGSQMSPGQQSPALVFEALGLPTIVTYWVRGYVPPAPLTEADTLPVVAPSDPLVENSVPDTTVGVEPMPGDRSPGNLLTRVRGLLDQTCGTLAWVTSTSVCTALQGRLDAASQAITNGNTAAAETEVQGFVTELESQHGPGLPINDSAYWLLRVNAEYILTRL